MVVSKWSRRVRMQRVRDRMLPLTDRRRQIPTTVETLSGVLFSQPLLLYSTRPQ